MELTKLKEKLSTYLREERIRYYGHVKSSWVKYAEDYYWDDEGQQNFRIQDMIANGFLPGRSRILDMASGCGQFIFNALKKGYDCFGVEPEQWKIEFIKEKNRIFNRLSQWEDRIICAYGEKLSFEDNFFDCVTSYQTLEHVQNPLKVLSEMIRVTKIGGGILLYCPDYRSTFEAHYQLPWLPLFPRKLAKKYLIFLKRPVEGLENIQYVTYPKIVKWLNQLEKINNFRLNITDYQKLCFENSIRRRGIPQIPGLFELYHFYNIIKYIGRREFSVSMFIRVLEK